MAKKLTAETITLPSALHLPVRVLAQLPDKLTELGIAIVGSASLIPRSQEEEEEEEEEEEKERIASFNKAHSLVAVAYDDANDTAKGIVDALSELARTVDIEEAIDQAATSAKTLTSVIGKVCVDIHQAQRFRSIFSDKATVDATVAALCAHAEEISTTLKRFVY